MKIKDVCERLSISREKLKAIPFEILPYVDIGHGEYAQVRYHPADVLAADARLRAWKRAQEHGDGEAYLQELRVQLEERDRAAMALAWEATTAA